MTFLKSRNDIGVVLFIFIASRLLATAWLGITFDTSPLPYYWQYIDVPLLQHNLLQSVYYLHSQPPLFNLFLGVVLQLFPTYYAVAFKIIYLLLGVGIALSLLTVLQGIGLGKKLSTVVTCIFIINPVLIEYENWLFYDYPACCLLLLSVVCLQNFLASRSIRSGMGFFGLLALMVCTRGLLSLSWFLVVLGMLTVFDWRHWKIIAKTAVLPLACIVLLYAKNYMVFGSFSTSEAQVGSNLATTITQLLPKETIHELIANHTIHGVSQLSQFCPLPAYAPYGVTPEKTGIPILDAPAKQGGWVNTHNLLYLNVGRIDYQDAVYVMQHYWPQILKARLHTTLDYYFNTADQCQPYYQNGKNPRWQAWKHLYRFYVLGGTSYKPLFMLIGLPLLACYGCFFTIRTLIRRMRHVPVTPSDIITMYMVLTIAWIFMSSLFILYDQSRYRFMIDPFYMVLLGQLLMQAIGFAKAGRIRAG